MHKPKQSHMNSAFRIVKYVRSQPGLGLYFPIETDTQLLAYCYSDWASSPETIRSISYFCTKFGKSLVAWRVKKQSTILKSSVES